MQNTEPDSNAVFFSFPVSARTAIIVALVAQSGLLTFSIYAFAFEAKHPDVFWLALTAAFFGWLGEITLRRLRALNDRIAADDIAIWYLPRNGVATCIPWNEIAGLQQHQIMSYLSIADASGTRKIKLEYGLENFDKLQKLIHKRTATPQAQGHEWRGVTPVKTLVRALYIPMRMISLPFILFDKLYSSGRPYVTVASVTSMLAVVVWILAPARDGIVATVAILLPGLLLAYLFGLWGKEFEREREVKHDSLHK